MRAYLKDVNPTLLIKSCRLIIARILYAFFTMDANFCESYSMYLLTSVLKFRLWTNTKNVFLFLAG